MLCQFTAVTSCEAVKVKLLSILGFIGKMAAKKDNTLDVLKVCYLFKNVWCVARHIKRFDKRYIKKS